MVELKYIGGKYRIRKQISKMINETRKENQTYIEPFVGGGHIMASIDTSKGLNYAYDIHEGLITLYNSVKIGWIPPISISEEEYKVLKTNQDLKNPLTAFAGFGCSFGGKYFGGYARATPPRFEDFCGETKKWLLHTHQIQEFIFGCVDYQLLNPTNCMVYCDAPYIGTTKYKSTPNFKYDNYYAWLRKISKTNTVFISEYVMPNDFEPVLEIKTKTELRTTKNGREDRIEKVFVYHGV